jgi:hypothetical protein
MLAIKSMSGECAEAWRAVLDDLIKRGLRRPEFLIVECATGAFGRPVWPQRLNYDDSFDWLGARDPRPEGRGLYYLDHLTHNVAPIVRPRLCFDGLLYDLLTRAGDG